MTGKMPPERNKYLSHGSCIFRHAMLVLSVMMAATVMAQETGAIAAGEGDWSVVYTGEITGKGDPGPARKIGDLILGSSRVSLNKPVNITCRDGIMWILNQGGGNILRMEKDVAEVPPALRRQKTVFPSLAGITAADGGRILFTDSKLNKVFLLSANGRKISELNDSLVPDQPTGIAYSAARREIWIAETASHRITITDEGGKVVRQIGKRGTGPGEFNYPTSVWIDQQGIAYVVDALNFRIQIFDPEGRFINAFGRQGDATGSFARPKGIATDTYGNIYVTDALFNAVQVFDRDGRLLYYFGTQGRGSEQFWMPSGIFIDDENNIFIADSYNSRIQLFRLKGRSMK
jgi:DNA-binding beta-propeller fold protein YncE